ncbi:RNA polymerase sigma-70 factor [Chitinophaga horti]|uniref:RNA polymerase sigma-70 factor n=1 Tax=Chitinophaga horti TaxID=2920382 RepID=A0ABY6JB00_9BACT|nr:RNA polymerase sigma-70 factor [Chitinophaga horti]UYQ95489.1 RNA polymerase sigma-70 factor [Chitinophaga horti]
MPEPGNNELHNERELVQMIAAGDALAFETLFRHYWDPVFSFALVMMKDAGLADDIAQDVFVDFWKQREKMAAVLNVKAFLFNAVKFAVHKKLRRLKVEDAYLHYQSHRLQSTDAEASMQLKELQQVLEEGIRLLPPQQQRAFRLSREQGLKHEEIGLQMGVSAKTVKDYIVRAIAFLRVHLGQYSRLPVILTIYWLTKR